MAGIQVVTAITLNGFLPEPAGALVSWVRNDRSGFPFGVNAARPLYCPIPSLICFARKTAGTIHSLTLLKS